jgi:hypothetical protein
MHQTKYEYYVQEQVPTKQPISNNVSVDWLPRFLTISQQDLTHNLPMQFNIKGIIQAQEDHKGMYIFI